MKDVHQQNSPLWAAFLDGDHDAFAELYAQNIADLLGYGYRICHDRGTVRDQVQDLFLHLWQHRENLGQTGSVRFYLFRALRNRLLKIFQNPVSSQEETFLAHRLPPEMSIETKWIEAEMRGEQAAKLRRAVEGLPKRQQEAIQLRYFHDFGPEEIGEMMGIGHQSARNLLHRAVSSLREIFF